MPLAKNAKTRAFEHAHAAKFLAVVVAAAAHAAVAITATEASTIQPKIIRDADSRQSSLDRQPCHHVWTGTDGPDVFVFDAIMTSWLEHVIDGLIVDFDFPQDRIANCRAGGSPGFGERSAYNRSLPGGDAPGEGYVKSLTTGLNGFSGGQLGRIPTTDTARLGPLQAETFADSTVPVAVPGPLAGAGVPGLVMAVGGFLAWRRRKAAMPVPHS